MQPFHPLAPWFSHTCTSSILPNPSFFLPLVPPLINPLSNSCAIREYSSPAPHHVSRSLAAPERWSWERSRWLMVTGWDSPGAALGRAQIQCSFLGVCSLGSRLLLRPVLWACGDGPVSIQGTGLLRLSPPSLGAPLWVCRQAATQNTEHHKTTEGRRLQEGVWKLH